MRAELRDIAPALPVLCYLHKHTLLAVYSETLAIALAAAGLNAAIALDICMHA